MIYDGLDAGALARLVGSPQLELRASVTSALDLAHQLGADGAPAGTLVLADEQTAGRGRQGRVWHSPAGCGVWMTVLLRPEAPPLGGALAIRAGLAVVDAVVEAAPGISPRLKWPNDVIVAERKAGGVLCEARWTGDRLAWVAVGIGINVSGAIAPPVRDRAIALGDISPGVTRVGLVAALVPRIRALGAMPAALGAAERKRFLVATWRGDGEPEPVGVEPDGALLVRGPDGELDRRVLAS